MRASLLIAMLAIFGSYYAEYGLEIAPCKLCLYQRYVWFIVVGIALGGYRYAKVRCALPLVMAAGIAISCYHLGIIEGIFEDRCQYSKPPTLEEYRAILKSGPIVSCSKIDWKIVGIPAPLFNLFLILIRREATLYFKHALFIKS